jgi:hypothetical protein
MGFRCTWIASRGTSGDHALSQLRLARESQSNEPVYDPGLYGLALPTGWYLAIGDGWDYMEQLNEEQAAALSRDRETLFFYTDDTPMATRLASYRNGSLVWAITYDGSNGVGEPEMEGELPPIASDVLSRVRHEQEEEGGRSAGVDCIYELTAEVARMLVGFRHDQTLGDGKIIPIDQLVPRHLMN